MDLAELGVLALDALGFGLLLYLVAAGLVLVLRAARFLHLAQGAFVAVGAAGSVAAFHLVGSALPAIALACAAVVPLAMAAEILIVRPLQGKPAGAQVAAAFGLFLILADVTALLASPEKAFLPLPDWLATSITLPGGFSYSGYRVAAIAAALAGTLGLAYFSSFTRSGARARALSDDAKMAAALGIEPQKYMNAVFGIACLLAALVGSISIALLNQPGWPADGWLLALAVAAVLWGGSGSLRGVFIAALAISFLDRLARDLFPTLAGDLLPPTSISSATLSAAVIFMATALMLIVRPHGLFARQNGWETRW
jgi:branched-chain amino acid transport system permease protein